MLCPKDSGTLDHSERPGSGFITRGVVRCSSCQSSYEILDGILRILPAQQPVSTLVQDEQKARDLQAERYDRHFTDWANAVELSAILGENGLLAEKTVLDVACGTGRITTHLLPVAGAVVATDLSEQSLRIFAQKVNSGAKLGLIWSDTTQLRLLPESFDLAVSTQLLEHIPTARKRIEFLDRVHNALKPDGVFLLSVYYYSWLRRILKKRQEGCHASGIFYHRFTIPELSKELSGLFQVRISRPIQIDPRFLPDFILSTSWLARALEKSLICDLIGHLLFVKACKVRPTPTGN